jgi:hypothetical protein
MNEGRITVRLCVFFFALYALTSSGNPFRVPDEFEVYFQAEHLLDAGDLSVPQTLAVTQGGQPIFFGLFGRDGRPYAPYGPGVAFLILPFHIAGRAVASMAGVPRNPLPRGIVWELLVGGITTWAMAAAAALAVAGAFRASRGLGASVARALALAVTLGGATILWPSATTLYSEAALAACFVWAAAFLIDARVHPRPFGRVATAAVLLMVAGITKPTALVVAPGFILAVLVSRDVKPRSRAIVAGCLAVAIAVAASVHLAWNIARFGRPLEFGYNLAGMIPKPPMRTFIPEQVPWGLFVQLLTPGKSLFAWAPLTLLSVLTLRTAWIHERGVVAGLIASSGAALVFYAAFFLPEGGYSHGPRHLVPLVPLFVLPLAVPGVPLPRRALVAAAGVGFVIAALAVSISFLEDQSPAATATGRPVSPYHQRIDDPGPGEANIRYRVDYIPFKYALTSGHWLAADRPVGEGPDFFALHLARARQFVPGGAAIPRALPWLLSIPWMVLAAAAGYALAREWKSTTKRSNA